MENNLDKSWTRSFFILFATIWIKSICDQFLQEALFNKQLEYLLVKNFDDELNDPLISSLHLSSDCKWNSVVKVPPVAVALVNFCPTHTARTGERMKYADDRTSTVQSLCSDVFSLRQALCGIKYLTCCNFWNTKWVMYQQYNNYQSQNILIWLLEFPEHQKQKW